MAGKHVHSCDVSLSPNYSEYQVGNRNNFSDGTPNSARQRDIPLFRTYGVIGYIKSEHYIKKWRFLHRDSVGGVIIKQYP